MTSEQETKRAEYADAVRFILGSMHIRHVHLADECLDPLIDIFEQADKRIDEPLLDHLMDNAEKTRAVLIEAQQTLTRFSTAYGFAAIGKEAKQ